MGLDVCLDPLENETQDVTQAEGTPEASAIFLGEFLVLPTAFGPRP